MINNSEGNLFVKNIDPSKTPKEFNKFFVERGPPVITTTLKTDGNGDSLGYGYVQYAKKELADKCRETLNGVKFGECKIMIEPFKRKPQRNNFGNKCNIYVKNIPYEEG